MTRNRNRKQYARMCPFKLQQLTLNTSRRLFLTLLIISSISIIIWWLSYGDDRPKFMGSPHEYATEVDFRLIILTYNRPESLRKCLERVARVETLGDRVHADVWVDRSRDGRVDRKMLEVVDDFRRKWPALNTMWNGGGIDVHVQPEHAYIVGQWVNTWRPRADTQELALILEDDIDLSPMAYRWLKAVNKQYGSSPEVAGYTLQMENVNFVLKNNNRRVRTPGKDPIFMYQLIGTWGFAPRPNHWRAFQDWFHEMWKNPDFRPYIPGKPTELDVGYRALDRYGRRFSMWEMYPIHYFHTHSLYTVYPNLLAYTGRADVLLDTHRAEAGLHFRGGAPDHSHLLLRHWDPDYVRFPRNVTRYVWDNPAWPPAADNL